MRLVSGALLLLCAACFGQVSDSNVPQRKQILQNRRVTVSRVELAPGEATSMHRHDHDFLTVFVNGGHTQNTISGRKPTADTMTAGEVRFRSAGYTHAAKNDGPNRLQVVMVEFSDPQGKAKQIGTKSRYCNPGRSTACVDETNLFCTDRVCVEDVTIAPGAITTKHSHATDHMLVAVSDYQLSDQVEGKGVVVRSLKSGEVEYIPAGINHQLTNTGSTEARFTVIVWR